MTVFSLYPAFVRIEYASDYGPHTMTRPTRAWVGTPWDAPGSYVCWDESTIAANTMIEGLITKMLPMLPPEVSVSSYLIYTQADPEAEPMPVFAKNLTGQTGSSLSDAWYPAMQRTYSYLTTANHAAKLILLDAAAVTAFGKVTTLPPGGELDLVNELMLETRAWAGRDDARIVAWRSLTLDTNEALRRKYRFA